jgi:RNA polymerase sigma-70 factor (ECF subfamily)
MVSSRFRVRGDRGDEAAQADALARRIRGGDAAAEAAFVERYHAPLEMLLRKRVKDPTLAEDLCQDVFRIALGALRNGRLQDGSKLASYLAGIARNLASTERRLRQRDRQSAVTETLADQVPRADHRMLAAERARLVREAVRRLAARDRAVLTAFYLSDMPKDAICERLHLTPAQFDVIKWRALKRLLAALGTHQGTR